MSETAKIDCGFRLAEPVTPRVAPLPFAGARERRPNPAPEEVPAGWELKRLVKGDGAAYFQLPRSRSFDLDRLVDTSQRCVGGDAEHR